MNTGFKFVNDNAVYSATQIVAVRLIILRGKRYCRILSFWIVFSIEISNREDTGQSR